MVEIKIGLNDREQRLDRFLKKYLKNMPLSGIYKLLRNDVKVNGKRRKENYLLMEGDIITIYMSSTELKELTLRKKSNSLHIRNFKIVYEDENLLVVGKPYGLLTHGNHEEKKNTLVNQVLGYLVQRGEYDYNKENTFSPAPVNRLDRNTTGLVVFGKNSSTLKTLNAKWKEVNKYYLAIVSGEVREELTLKGSLLKDEGSNKVEIGDSGIYEKEIITFIKPVSISGYKKFSLVEIRLDTGRSHQIRAHLANIGHPLIGDNKYGNKRQNLLVGESTQLLHSYKLKFNFKGGELIYLKDKEVSLDPPKRFMDMMKKLDLYL